MDKMIVVAFDTERQACEGTKALQDLHAKGTVSLYAYAVIAKDADGNTTVEQAVDPEPLGTAVGLVTGSIVGLIGGPIGVAVGATTGMAGGALFDLGTTGVGADFLAEAAESLQPGKAALVAEIEEEWVLPLDERMEALGGTVLRRTRGEVTDAQIERDIAVMEADLAAMEAEYEQASEEAKANLQTNITAAKAQLQQTEDRAKAQVEATQREGQAKIAVLKEQAHRAHEEHKAQIDKRVVQVKADYEQRKAKLDQAMQLHKGAWRATREAVSS